MFVWLIDCLLPSPECKRVKVGALSSLIALSLSWFNQCRNKEFWVFLGFSKKKKYYWLTCLKGIYRIPDKPQQTSWFPYRSWPMSNLVVIDRGAQPPGKYSPWIQVCFALNPSTSRGGSTSESTESLATYELHVALAVVPIFLPARFLICVWTSILRSHSPFLTQKIFSERKSVFSLKESNPLFLLLKAL